MRSSIILLYAYLIEVSRRLMMKSNKTIKLLFLPGFCNIRGFNSKARAYAAFYNAKKRVPAYASFLKENNFQSIVFKGLTPILNNIPVTDKNNYVNKFSIEQRCIGGKMPSTGLIIDESSGASGTATNWVRGKSERKRNAQFIKFGAQNLLGNGPLFIINAFALGPWATGMNITMSCIPFAKLKSTGPDKNKIENTLLHFGNTHKYLIMGYPPFLQKLVSTSSIMWDEYDVTFICGGESMSEGMRDYILQKGIKNMYSSFGASDLELNMASENEFTISLRKLLGKYPDLRKKIVSYEGAMPMVFQFNPADFLFEANDEGQLIVTICRPGYTSPKIRYNIRDKGEVVSIKRLYALLKELNIEETELKKPSTDIPLLLHYGRVDMTVSFFGANIGPEDIQESVYKLSSLSNIINSFCIDTLEDIAMNKKLIITFELHENIHSNIIISELKPTYEKLFFEQLACTNQDFKEAMRICNTPNQTEIQFCEYGTGPFKNNDIRIKAKYFIKQ